MILASAKYKGDFVKTITVTTNDPRHASETLTCKGKVLVPITVAPTAINFGQLSRKASTPQQQKVIITRGDGPSLAPKLTPVAVQGLTLELNEVQAGERYELTATLSPPFPESPLRSEVTVETGLPDPATTAIPVYASLAPRVVAQPQQVTVPLQRPSTWQQAIQVKWDDDLPHRIAGATIDDAQLIVEVEESDNQQQVVVRVPEGYANAMGLRNLVIKTDDVQIPELRVPVTFARPQAPRSPTTRPAGARDRPQPTPRRPGPTSRPAPGRTPTSQSSSATAPPAQP